MLNTVVEFKKPKRVRQPVIKEATPTHYMGYRYPKFRPEDERFAAGLKFLQDFDYQNAFENYPDNPISECLTKQEILSTRITVTHLAKVAIFARDLLNNEEVAAEFIGYFNLFYKKEALSINLKCLNEDQIGYAIWLGEDLRTNMQSGQHPAAYVRSLYELYNTCWKVL